MNHLTTVVMTSVLSLGYGSANATPPQDDVPSVAVRFADLDLTHRDGVTVLYHRLKDGAQSVCALHNGRDVASQTRYKICWQTALSAAVAKVDQAALTAYYRAQFQVRNAPIQVAQH